MQLIPLCTIRVKRDDKSITPVIGKPFEFTAAEKADLDAVAAQSGSEYYRLPVNESVPVATVQPEVEVEQEEAKPVKPAKAAKKADESL